LVDSKKLQDKAKEVLVRDDVRRLIGWKRGTYGYEAAPAVIKEASDAELLIFDPTCVQNPASFITLEEKLPVPRGAEPDTRKVAVMVKGCDSRAVVQQLVEKAYDREDVIVLGIPCRGVIDRRKAEKMFGDVAAPVEASLNGDKVTLTVNGEKKEAKREELLMDKCLRCRYPNPLVSDFLLDDEVEKFADDDLRTSGHTGRSSSANASAVTHAGTSAPCATASSASSQSCGPSGQGARRTSAKTPCTTSSGLGTWREGASSAWSASGYARWTSRL
jgi:hypothetical protein